MLPASADNRLYAIGTFVLGFIIITAAYMVPILGFVTWTMMGVFGLGASTLAFVAAYRRENPLPIPRVPATRVVAPIDSVLDRPSQEATVSADSRSIAFEQPVPAIEVATPSVVGTLPHASFRDRRQPKDQPDIRRQSDRCHRDGIGWRD